MNCQMQKTTIPWEFQYHSAINLTPEPPVALARTGVPFRKASVTEPKGSKRGHNEK